MHGCLKMALDTRWMLQTHEAEEAFFFPLKRQWAAIKCCSRCVKIGRRERRNLFWSFKRSLRWREIPQHAFTLAHVQPEWTYSRTLFSMPSDGEACWVWWWWCLHVQRVKLILSHIRRHTGGLHVIIGGHHSSFCFIYYFDRRIYF